MKKTVRRKRLVLKQWVQEWLAVHAFGYMMYIAIFAWLFDDRWVGLGFATVAMLGVIAIEIIYKIFKKIAKNLLTKLAK